MNDFLAVPIAVPLTGAALTLLVRGSLAFRRITGIVSSLVVALSASWLVAQTSDGEVLASHVGGWRPEFGITLAADLFSSMMLFVGALMVIVCSAFAISIEEDRHLFFYPLVLALEAGFAGAFLTADIFNLFVFFELMLIASYVLLTLGGKAGQVRRGAVYVTSNLMASTLFLAGVALTYAVAGTVNMAELSLIPDVVGKLVVPGSLLLVAFGVKASLVPVHGWLPRAYPDAPPATAALFSGLLTKVGVYAIYRVYSVVFGGDQAFQEVLLVVAGVTMVAGVLGAVARNGFREILSFHIVSQVGYMIMGVALFGPLGLAGGIFYILHHIVVKTSLFLSAGAVETIAGTGQLNRLGGMARRAPLLAGAFIVAALSLAGLPPLSGFFAKLILIRSAFDTQNYVIAAVAIVVSFLTLTSMVKIYNGVFWGESGEPGQASRPTRMALVLPAVVLAATTVGLGIGAESLFGLAEQAAGGLVDPARYVSAVLGR